MNRIRIDTCPRTFIYTLVWFRGEYVHECGPYDDLISLIAKVIEEERRDPETRFTKHMVLDTEDMFLHSGDGCFDLEYGDLGSHIWQEYVPNESSSSSLISESKEDDKMFVLKLSPYAAHGEGAHEMSDIELFFVRAETAKMALKKFMTESDHNLIYINLLVNDMIHKAGVEELKEITERILERVKEDHPDAEYWGEMMAEYEDGDVNPYRDMMPEMIPFLADPSNIFVWNHIWELKEEDIIS